MTVKELITILEDYDIDINIHFAENRYNEEIDNIDIWTTDFFEREV